MDPHEAYQGWSAIRYGVGETLFKFDDAMQPQPWLAKPLNCIVIITLHNLFPEVALVIKVIMNWRGTIAFSPE